MHTLHAKSNLLILFLCTLLTIQPLNCMPPQELSFEPSQPYAIICFISFCIGAALCALIHKYCVHQPVIQPIKDSSEKKEEKKKIFDALNTNILTIKTEQQKMVDIVTEQSETTKNFTITNNWMQLVLCAVAYQTSLAKNDLLLKKVKRISKERNGYVPAPVAYYWMNKYKEQTTLLEEYKRTSMSTEAQLLFGNKPKELIKAP
ncbi:MAG TPA: hypothetical protein VJJ26_00045 [Candidatus Babeliales bacterium]|nr:hypothetical protein [Candidatus Babeliales bacterium]